MMLRCACEVLRGWRKDSLRKKREHGVDYRDVYGLARKDIVVVVAMVSNPRRLETKIDWFHLVGAASHLEWMTHR